MKKITLLLSLFIFYTFTQAQSPRKQAKDSINNIIISIDYGSPSVKGRKIWGELEKYNEVWRAGANENTTISFDKNVVIGGNLLKAGKYGFFIIPRAKDKWTIIFNSKNDGWGAFSYKKKEDVLRYDVMPKFEDNNKENLEYKIENNAIVFRWEKISLKIPVEQSM